MSETQPFDLTGPLPDGITVLEASAGTGKTYSIAHLLVRLVAEEGVGIEEVLVVTFTRLATAELRDRLRARLAEAAAALEGEPVADSLLEAWAAGAPDDARATWLRRIQVAREDFDAAAVSTIHSFCGLMLQTSAFESGSSFDRTLVTDLGPLLDEIVADWLTAARYGTGDDDLDAWTNRALRDACQLGPDAARSLAGQVVADLEVTIPPATGPTLAEWRALLAPLRAAIANPDLDLRPVFEQAKAAKLLDGRSYQTRYTLAHWDRLVAWVEGDPVPVAGGGSWPSYFGREKLTAKAKGDISLLLEHPVIVALEPVLDGMEAAVTRVRTRFAEDVRAALDARLRQRGEQGMSDLLRELAAALRDPGRGPALREAIRARFRVGLIDEFQDTDALQWEVFSTLFAPREGDAERLRLFLIGDPKQAIYAFRGANVHVYLRARGEADQTYTMTRNFRSDAPLVAGLNHLMDRPGIFGDASGQGIAYVPVDTPDRAPPARLTAAGAPVQIRLFDGALVGKDPGETIGKGDARPAIAEDVAAQAAALLSEGAQVADEAAPTGWRAVHPGDLAVLVPTHGHAQVVAEALRAAGVPATITRSQSVFASGAALDLQRWLQALNRPGHDATVRSFAATPLGGFDAPALARVDPDRWSELVASLDAARATFNRFGFMRAFRQLMRGREGHRRVLALPDGERVLTDLLHVAELAHTAQAERGLGLAGLLTWLRSERDDPNANQDAALARLETDARAARVLTLHASKGLEFPVVFVPYLWDGSLIKAMERGKLVIPDAVDPTLRSLDLRTLVPRDDPDQRRLEAARQREKMRLFYVAVTRPKHRLVLWWGAMGHKMQDSHQSPLAVVLHGEGGGDRFATAASRVRKATTDDLLPDLEALADASSGTVSLVRLGAAEVRRWAPPPVERPALAARAFHRSGVDSQWGLYSYSSLTRGAAALSVHGRDAPPDAPGRDADAGDRSADPLAAADPAVADVPLASFPAGAEAGTCLHAFYEHADFAWAHPDTPSDAGAAAARELLAGLLPRHGFDAHAHLTDGLVAGLLATLRTPLGGEAGGLRLCDLSRHDRFDELRFDLPLAGGRDWRPGAPTIEAAPLAAALTAAPSPGIRSEYLDHLRTLPFGRLRLAGFMTGAIDLVFRDPRDGRFYVVDYKSNRIDPKRTRRYPVSNFTLPLMQAEMEHHHYHLQYLLYTLALHRYLRHRLGKGYDYERCVGGVYYLFFRGMTGEALGPDGAAPHGVFHDRPPAAVLDALDALFHAPGRSA